MPEAPRSPLNALGLELSLFWMSVGAGDFICPWKGAALGSGRGIHPFLEPHESRGLGGV